MYSYVIKFFNFDIRMYIIHMIPNSSSHAVFKLDGIVCSGSTAALDNTCTCICILQECTVTL